MENRGSRIQQEIKQTRPFGTASQEAAVALLRTADVVRRRIAAVIEPYGVSPQQYNVLRILRGAGPDGLPTLEVAERLIERTPGITRLCDCLERRGLLERVRSTEDRRVVRCRIAPAGLDLLKQLDEPVLQADTTALGPLGVGELSQLIALLDRVRAADSTASEGPASIRRP